MSLQYLAKTAHFLYKFPFKKILFALVIISAILFSIEIEDLFILILILW
jgi:hypothetical protein